MLPRRMFGLGRVLALGRVFACGLAVLALSAASALAQARLPASASLVPGDAAFYSSSLRNREQIDALLGSKAWAKLMNMPIVKMGLAKLEEEWTAGHLVPLRNWYEQEENRQFVQLLKDLIADEVFVCGGKSSTDILTLFQELQSASQFGPLMLMMQGRFEEANRPDAQIRVMLQAVAAKADRLKAPDIVIGFKAAAGKPLQDQLARLEKLGQMLGQNPIFKDRFQKTKIAGNDFLTLRLDGQMIPWDHIPLRDFEDNAGQFDELVKKLKDMKLTISIGARDGYLLLAVGEGTAGVEALGRGSPIAQRVEMRPLDKFGDHRITNISYASKDLQTVLSGGGRKELEEGLMGLVELLKNAGIPDQQMDKLRKDVKAMAKDLGRFMPEPGPASSISFLTDRGYESFSYDWSKNSTYDASKPLTLLQHVGGNPLIVAAMRAKYDPEEYKAVVKWLKVAHQHFEEIALPNLDDNTKDIYNQIMKQARPVFARLDKATGEMLLPALADGQFAFILDGKLTSKQWQMFMPESAKPLPFPEIAVVLGVKDAELLKKAFTEYRNALNELLAAVGQFVPVGELKIPEPESKKIEGGTLYSYPLPEVIGLDKQLMPTGALSSKVFALALSHSHATRLLTPTPLKTGSKLLADTQRPLSFALHVNIEGLVDAFGPWIEWGLDMGGIPEQDPFEIRSQVRTALEIIKAIRSYTSVSYVENGIAVTRSELVIRDVK